MARASVSSAPEAGADSPSGASTRGSHRLAAIATCERMWALRYHWYFRPTKERAATLGGSLIHTCFQYYFASKMTSPPPWFHAQSLDEALLAQAGRHPDASALIAMARGNLADYMSIWGEEEMEPLAIEQEFKIALGELDPGGPWPELDNEIVSCRDDLVCRLNGRIWLWDHKSHGRSRTNPRTGRLTRWKDDGEHAIDWQALLNLHITRAHYAPESVEGYIIHRTTRQPTTLGVYDFDRHVLRIPELAYKDTPRLAREWVKQEYEVLEKVDNSGRPRPSYHACQGRFGGCDYRPVCMSNSKEEMDAVLMDPTEYTQAPPEFIQAVRARLRVAP